MYRKRFTLRFAGKREENLVCISFSNANMDKKGRKLTVP